MHHLFLKPFHIKVQLHSGLDRNHKSKEKHLLNPQCFLLLIFNYAFYLFASQIIQVILRFQFSRAKVEESKNQFEILEIQDQD